MFGQNISFKMMMMKAREGNVRAQRYVGSQYQWGLEGLKKDTVQALYWLSRAADQGDDEAAYSAAYWHG